MSNNRFEAKDYTEIIKKELAENEELKKEYFEAEIEYELRKMGKELAKYRKEHNIQQGSISEQTYLTQQMISRIENMNPKPSMETFLKYLHGIGLKIKFECIEEDEKTFTDQYSTGLLA